MAASITLNSTTAEGQLVELITRIQMLEGSDVNNPNNLNRVTGNFNQDTGIYTGSFNLVCVPSVDSSGFPTFQVETYLNDYTGM